MVLQTLIAKLEQPWQLKFPALLLIVFFVLFSSYHLLVRNTWLGVLLNGKRLGWTLRSKLERYDQKPSLTPNKAVEN